MRILVADQNSLLLAAITATFGPHCDLVTATRRDVCLAQLEQHKFDVVIAGDKLSDYTGLELLSEVPVISPDTLLIFAADPKRLQQLGKRLAVFGLFEAISYPLTPQKLVDVLRRAREKLQATRQPTVRHVVLESEWDTGERLGLIEREAQEADGAGDFVFAGPPTVQAATSGSAERLLGGTPVVSAAGVPDGGGPAPNRASTGRTFEGTPVAPSSETVVAEYEVKPSLPALVAEDEFVFATEVDTTVRVTPASAPIVQETVPEVAGDDTQEAATTDEEFDAELEFLCSNDAVFDVPEPPKWAEDGAANDLAFESKTPLVERQRGGASESGASRGRPAAELPAPSDRSAAGDAETAAAKVATSSSKSGRDSKATPPAEASGPKDPPQPRARAQTVPTDAQRAAFERALARRNAGQGPGAAAENQASSKARKAKPTIQLGSTAGVFTGLPMSGRSSASLSELAKIATSKRPLADTKGGKTGKVVPNRAVFAVGSGVAAVLILGVLSFELLKRSGGEAQHHMPHAQAQSTQIFSPTPTLMASSEGGPAQLVAPPPLPPEGQPAVETGTLNPPQAQNFDPDSAPADPPPPPILEHPGPSEPPSMGHGDPPWANAEAWGTTSSDSQESPNQ